jgi:hypothetical protein
VEIALDGLIGDEGPDRLTRELLQEFLWYRLPLHVAEDPDHSVHIAAGLARVLDTLGLSQYAAICRSTVTQWVLRAYAAGEEAGLAAYRRADSGSGIRPPDVPELRWGSTMGGVEAQAYSSCADVLERAVAAGDLVPVAVAGEGARRSSSAPTSSHRGSTWAAGPSPR